MKDKLNKRLAIGIAISVLVMIIGYFLWEDFTPSPDPSSLSVEEIMEIQAQTETSIQTTIGALFLNVGFIAGAICLGTIAIRQILALFKK